MSTVAIFTFGLFMGLLAGGGFAAGVRLGRKASQDVATCTPYEEIPLPEYDPDVSYEDDDGKEYGLDKPEGTMPTCEICGCEADFRKSVPEFHNEILVMRRIFLCGECLREDLRSTPDNE